MCIRDRHPGVVINNMGEMELVNYDGVVLYLYPDGTLIFTRGAPRPRRQQFPRDAFAI